MKIRYKTSLAVLFIVCAVFVLATSLLNGPSISTLTGGLILFIGISYLVRPLGELTDTELTVLALFGPIKRRYPIAELRMTNGRIYAGDKKVPMPSWTVHNEDWQALMKRIESRPAS